MSRAPRKAAIKRAGFSLIELVVVLVILGILFGMAIPKVENLSPKYSLRAAARSIASQLEFVRSTSIFRHQTYGFYYDFEHQTYGVIAPPEEGGAEIPFEDWPKIGAIRLPNLVKFEAVILPDNTSIEEGEAVIVFDPLGCSGSHVVVLRNINGQIISVKFNALTGTVDFYGEPVGFAHCQ